jgi:nucleoside permease NupC
MLFLGTPVSSAPLNTVFYHIAAGISLNVVGVFAETADARVFTITSQALAIISFTLALFAAIGTIVYIIGEFHNTWGENRFFISAKVLGMAYVSLLSAFLLGVNIYVLVYWA